MLEAIGLFTVGMVVICTALHLSGLVKFSIEIEKPN
jgi:hypothetical protein